MLGARTSTDEFGRRHSSAYDSSAKGANFSSFLGVKDLAPSRSQMPVLFQRQRLRASLCFRFCCHGVGRCSSHVVMSRRKCAGHGALKEPPDCKAVKFCVSKILPANTGYGMVCKGAWGQEVGCRKRKPILSPEFHACWSLSP